MLIVGLTGNYGTGKTLVLETFGKLGAYTIDADAIVGELLKDKAVIARLVPIVGESCLDDRGNLYKRAVSDIIFKDESRRLQVEDILHPLVFERTDELLREITADVVVIEAALIFERGYEKRFDKIITVHTDDETAVKRLQRTGVKTEDIMRRLLSQMPIKEKVKRSTLNIDNNGTEENTKEQVKLMYEALKAEAASAAEEA
jgi:dephospho-CoA kinase